MPVYFIYSSHCDYFNIEFLFTETFLTVFGNDDFFKPQLLSLCNTLFNPIHRPDLAAQSDFACETSMLWQWNIFK